MQQLNETIFEKARIVESSPDKLPKGVLARVTWPIMRFGAKNKNGRRYSKGVCERIMTDPDVQERQKNRCLYGVLEHPQGTVATDISKASHIVIETFIDGDVGFQTCDILNTPAGQIVHALLLAECMVGTSTRAEGELRESEENGERFMDVVAETYSYKALDVVSEPSTPNSIPVSVQHNVAGIVQKGFESRELSKTEAKGLLEMCKEDKDAKAILEEVESAKDCKCNPDYKCAGCEDCKAKKDKEVEESKTVKEDAKVTDRTIEIVRREDDKTNYLEKLQAFLQKNTSGKASKDDWDARKDALLTQFAMENGGEYLADKEVLNFSGYKLTESAKTNEDATVDAKMTCKDCGKEFNAKDVVTGKCPECKSTNVAANKSNDVFDKHQMRIAKDTLKMSDAGARIAGGMTKDEARAFLKKKGWSDERIAKLEESSANKSKKRVLEKEVDVNAKADIDGLDEFTKYYLVAALWSSIDGDKPMDENFDVSDIAEESLVEMKADCQQFQKENAADIKAYEEETGRNAGMDFWLSRNGHGSGFFDDDTEVGDKLQKIAREWGECDLYVGDDGKIYATGTGKRNADKNNSESVSEGKEIKDLYRKAKLTPPKGKGEHTKAFHALAIKIAKGYIDKGESQEAAFKKAYPTAMKQLGKKKAVNKSHQRNGSVNEATDEQLNRALEAAKTGDWDKANEILGGNGVEYVGVDDVEDSPELKYINLGDTYDTTICQEDGKKPYIGSWGDWYENAQSAYESDNDVVRCGYCGEFAPRKEGVEWRDTVCPSCGYYVDGSKKAETKKDENESKKPTLGNITKSIKEAKIKFATAIAENEVLSETITMLEESVKAEIVIVEQHFNELLDRKEAEIMAIGSRLTKAMEHAKLVESTKKNLQTLSAKRISSIKESLLKVEAENKELKETISQQAKTQEALTESVEARKGIISEFVNYRITTLGIDKKLSEQAKALLLNCSTIKDVNDKLTSMLESLRMDALHPTKPVTVVEVKVEKQAEEVKKPAVSKTMFNVMQSILTR